MAETFWTVGDVVRKLRERRGWTQVDLADAAQIDKSTIVRLEEGGDQTKPTTLKVVATALGVTVARIHQIAEGVPEHVAPLVTAAKGQPPTTTKAVTNLMKAPPLKPARKDHH